MHVFARDKQSIDMGMSQYVLVTKWAFYRKLEGRYDESHVDVAAIDKAIKHYKMLDLDVPVVLDIEAFDPFDDFDHTVLQFHTALRRWKSAEPSRQVGIYRYLPDFDIWSPLGVSAYRGIKRFDKWVQRKQRVQRWRDHNDRMAKALLPHVDFIVPHIYCHKAGWLREWMEFADTNLDEAGRIAGGKPVWPIIMTEYTEPRDTIDAQDWAYMLELISKHPATDAIVIHDEDAAWDWRTPIKNSLIEAA